MPDQNLPNPPPTFPDIADIPPIPAVSDTLSSPPSLPESPKPLVQEIPEMAPPAPVIDNAPPPKNKGKIIATILGIFLLVGAVAAGVTLVKQNQEIREKAATTFGCNQSNENSLCDNDTSRTWQGWCALYYCPNGTYDVNASKCDGGPGYSIESGPCSDLISKANGLSVKCWQIDAISGDAISGPGSYCNVQGCNGHSIENQGCVYVPPTTNPPTTSTPTPTPTGGGGRRSPSPTPTQPPECPVIKPAQCPDGSWPLPSTNPVTGCNEPQCPKPTPTPTPTKPPHSPTPTPTAPMCLAVQAYDTSWNSLSGIQLSQLKAGDKVRFAIAGSPATDIDKAKFTINGITTAEITQKGTGAHANEYYYDYTIPAGVTSFTITAKLHSISLNVWF